MTKILLVEDDKSLREIYGVRLLAEGYDIVSAGDGEEALAMAIKERPSLIVSDVMMPKISGFDMLDILRSTTETKDIKVIMMTALSSEDQRQRGERLGADRYLVKSQVGIEDVVRTVHEVLGDAPGVGSTTPTQTANPTPSPVQSQPVSQPTPSPRVPERPSVESLSPQTPTPTPSPVQSQPVPPTPTFSTPPIPQAQITGGGAGLPQPTAPFSSPAPRPSNLGDRVIHPLDDMSEDNGPDLAKMMEKELSGTGIEPISVSPEPATIQNTPEIPSAQVEPIIHDNPPINQPPTVHTSPTMQLPQTPSNPPQMQMPTPADISTQAQAQSSQAPVPPAAPVAPTPPIATTQSQPAPSAFPPTPNQQ